MFILMFVKFDVVLEVGLEGELFYEREEIHFLVTSF